MSISKNTAKQILKQSSIINQNMSLLKYTSMNLMLQEFFDYDAINRKKVALIRHAQSEGNVKRLQYGKLDFPLTELGIEQSKQLTGPLKQNMDKIDKFYCSDRKRAWQTGKLALDLTENEAEKFLKK